MTGPVNKDYYRLASYATGAQINHNPFGVQELQSQLLFAGGTMALPIAFKQAKLLYGLHLNGHTKTLATIHLLGKN